MVKYVRNNFLLIELSLLGIEDVLNEGFWSKVEKDKDRDRKHYQEGEFISELYLEDKEKFLQLPTNRILMREI